MMGIPNKTMRRNMDEVIEFAGLEKFIDVPMKRYSTGMYVHLAAFQQKCLEKMCALRNAGTCFVFVSHNLWPVETFCDQALLLRNGIVEAEGPPHEAINTTAATSGLTCWPTPNICCAPPTRHLHNPNKNVRCVGLLNQMFLRSPVDQKSLTK
jgi:ABC-type polysaccharide/polyol phosphate transport system ATPase subunit